METTRVMAGYAQSVEVEDFCIIIKADTGEDVVLTPECLRQAGLLRVELGSYYQFEARRISGAWITSRIIAVFPLPYRVRNGRLIELPTDDTLGVLESEGESVRVSRHTMELSGFSWFELGHAYQFQEAKGRKHYYAARILSRFQVECSGPSGLTEPSVAKQRADGDGKAGD